MKRTLKEHVSDAVYAGTHIRSDYENTDMSFPEYVQKLNQAITIATRQLREDIPGVLT